jgi:hypothetical protein
MFIFPKYKILIIKIHNVVKPLLLAESSQKIKRDTSVISIHSVAIFAKFFYFLFSCFIFSPGKEEDENSRVALYFFE